MKEDKKVKSYSDFVNETEQKIVHNTNFAGMVQGAVNSIHSQVMAIAKAMADEKEARNPYRYQDADKTGGVEEVDITRALNLIFHSDWKNHLKSHQVHQWAKTCLERAGKHDERSNKKNQRALRTNGGEQEDNYKVDLGSQGFSRDTGEKI
jgi:SOS response regulatory protein OraA/RecX